MGIEEKLTSIAERIFKDTGFIMPDMEYYASIDEWDELMESTRIFHPCETKQLDTGQIQYRSDFGNFNIQNPRRLVLNNKSYTNSQISDTKKILDKMWNDGPLKLYQYNILKSSINFAIKNSERR